MDFWEYGNGSALRDLLDKNLVKYNHANTFIFLPGFLEFPNSLNYEWAGATRIDNENVSLISIEVPNARKFPVSFKVYISENDHAILRFDVLGSKNTIDYTLGPWHTEKLNEIYIFKRYEGKPYLSYIKKQYTIKKLDLVRKKVPRTEEYYRELLINNIITSNVDGLRKSMASKKSKEVSLALQAKEYNEAFWKNYNLIIESPLDKELIRFFEQKDGAKNLPKAERKRINTR